MEVHRETQVRREPGAHRQSWLAAAYSAVLTAVILGPLLGPGYLLLRDAVSTPRSYVTDSALGLTDAAARAVPQDAAIAVLSTVVDGGIVVKAIMFVALTLAGLGAAVLTRTVLRGAGVGAQLVAATVTLWNPYVAERLLQGHWSLLAGYAALPWTVCAVLALVRGERRAWWSLAVCFAAAGLTPTGSLLVAAAAAAVFVAATVLRARGSWRGLCAAFVLWCASASPWLAATVVAGGGTSDPAGVAAFAARAEPGLATLGSLAGLGGIWNADAVPATRTSLFAIAGTAVLLGVVACGLPSLWRRRREPVVAGLAVLAVVVIVGVALAATPPGLAAGRWAVESVPGAGLLRDAQKWVALAVPFYALAAAAGVHALRAVYRPALSAVAALAVVAALPDLAWGVGGTLRPVQYPAAWNGVTAAVRDEPGDVAVLPGGMFRQWGEFPVLDPAPRMLPSDVLQTGALPVAGGSVAGEGARAARVEEALLAGASPSTLADEGVRWVLVEHGTPGPLGESSRTLAGLEQRFADDDLTLYRVPGDVPETGATRSARAAVGSGHVLWALVLVGGAAGSVLTGRQGRRHQT
ncbi:hypothetical protein [Rhodococcus sp. HNM0569]|uniref:hypothetical protein n=1 Tax=Rhodococcus sp. HNM0569 TaxID=2716340 RepID=UPI00146CC8F5|nr:hypothetical protein [Rhodococcus sp. HNM0569]NLU83699.1 hypothetical protein [Rhodococcus sp. HNM0569]